MSGRWLGMLVLVMPLFAFAQETADTKVAHGTSPVFGHTRPDFSGDWQLNAKASDDPRAKLREAMQASRQAAGGGRGMGGGMGRGGGGKGRGDMGGAGGAGGMGGSSAELSGQLAAAQRLHISHEDPALLIVDENERPQRLYTDFRGGSVSAGGGLEQRVSVAGWEGAALVVETAMLGRKTIQQYAFDKANEQLVVTTQAEGPSMPRVSYRLVYDRVKPDPHSESAAATTVGADRAASSEETRR
jgi:hypothetical protein